MKSVAAALAFAVSSHALAIRNANTCCFGLSASGAVTGKAGQLGDGQVRINGPLSPVGFCITDGAITDLLSRGCILTPPTTQFQCDTGATPTSGFAIACDGTVSHNGDTTFWECQTGDNGEANIYVAPVDAVACGKIALKADSCGYCAPPPPSPPPATQPPAKTCPTDLNGPYEFPHLIIPVDSSKPDYAPGTSLFGEISSTLSPIFNFDIPGSLSGKTCSLVFLFPEMSQLTTSSYHFSGNGGIRFSSLSGTASQGTTYNNAPHASGYHDFTVSPGHSYNVDTFACPAGQAISFQLKANGDTYLNYFQDYNPSPIGLYITSC